MGVRLAIHHIAGRGWERVPLQIPPWIVLSGISPQAVKLYCLYQVSIASRRYSASVTGIPQIPEEYAVALHLDDVTQLQAAHQELLTVGAVEETQQVDEDGSITTVFGINELSPSQRVQDEQRRQQLADQLTTREALPVSKAPQGYVYAIRETLSQKVKLGYSDNVTRRYKQHQSSNPNPLELLWHTPGNRDLEDALKERFMKFRIHGEWYDFGTLDPVKEVSRAVHQIQARYPKTG